MVGRQVHLAALLHKDGPMAGAIENRQMGSDSGATGHYVDHK